MQEPTQGSCMQAGGRAASTLALHLLCCARSGGHPCFTACPRLPSPACRPDHGAAGGPAGVASGAADWLPRAGYVPLPHCSHSQVCTAARAAGLTGGVGRGCRGGGGCGAGCTESKQAWLGAGAGWPEGLEWPAAPTAASHLSCPKCPFALQSYDRLEFLGDAVLGLACRTLLMQRCPGSDEVRPWGGWWVQPTCSSAEKGPGHALVP